MSSQNKAFEAALEAHIKTYSLGGDETTAIRAAHWAYAYAKKEIAEKDAEIERIQILSDRWKNGCRYDSDRADKAESKLAEQAQLIRELVEALKIGARAERVAFEYKDEWLTDCEIALAKAQEYLEGKPETLKSGGGDEENKT